MNGAENGATERAGDGGGDGGGDGDRPPKKPKILDFLAFCDAITGKEDQLQPIVSVCEADEHGKGGELLAKVDLFPTATLDERVKDKVDGPCLVFLRTRTTTGQWSFCGRLKVLRARASTGTGDSSALALLMEQNRQLLHELKEERAARVAAQAAAAVPVETAKEKVSTLGELMNVAERLKPPPTPAPPTPAPQKSLSEQFDEIATAAERMGFVKQGGMKQEAESVIKHAITTFGESGNELLNTIARGLQAKFAKEASDADK